MATRKPQRQNKKWGTELEIPLSMVCPLRGLYGTVDGSTKKLVFLGIKFMAPNEDFPHVATNCMSKSTTISRGIGINQ